MGWQGWHCCHNHRGLKCSYCQRRQEYHKEGILREPPQQTEYLEQATVFETEHRIFVTGTDSMATETTASSTHEGFLQEWQVQTEDIGNSSALAEAFKNGKAVAVSDGSYMNATGTATWTIEGQSAMDRIVGTGYTPGSTTDQSAYRSELFGLWGILFTVLRFTKDNDIAQGAVIIACDGLSALKQAQY